MLREEMKFVNSSLGNYVFTVLLSDFYLPEHNAKGSSMETRKIGSLKEADSLYSLQPHYLAEHIEKRDLQVLTDDLINHHRLEDLLVHCSSS